MAYFDIEIACREGLGERKLIAMVQQRIISLGEDLDQSEQEFLTNYAYQDLRYYLLQKFGLMNLDNNSASFELCKRILKNEDSVIRTINEWFGWWIVKWRQRVRLAFNENEQSNDNVNPMAQVDDIIKKIPKNVLDKLRRETIIELIKQNEVCSLDVVSDFIIKSVFNDLINEYGRDGVLRLLMTNITELRLRIIKKIIEIKNSNQPLVILRVRINPSQPYQGIS